MQVQNNTQDSSKCYFSMVMEWLCYIEGRGHPQSYSSHHQQNGGLLTSRPSLYSLRSAGYVSIINYVTGYEIKSLILHKPALYQKFCILQVIFKKHTQISILYMNVYFSIKHSL